MPRIKGEFAGEMLHVRDYRSPEPFAGRRVVVLGAGQSALDVASEISFGAARTVLACRQGHHLLPRRLLGLPIDYFDIAALARVPWPLARWAAQTLLTSTPAAPHRGELPLPSFSILEHRWPALVTPNIERALAEHTLTIRPAVAALDDQQVVFADGRCEPADAVVFATGYRLELSLPRGAARPRPRAGVPAVPPHPLSTRREPGVHRHP